MLALPRPRRMSKETRRNLVAGLIFSSPFTLGFLAFTLYPMVASLVYSFQHYNGGGEQYGVQWRNYTYLFQSDDQFHQAVFNTLYMVVLGVPLTLVVGFLSAVLLNLPVKGQAIYRSAFVLPAFLPLVPVAMLWNWMFSAENGIVNYVLGFLRLPQPGWLIDPGWSKPSLILLNLWTVGTVTIIYLAALQDVPEALYEAAELDGAGWWSRLRHVTLPMVSSASFFNLITGVVATFQIFATAYVITLNTYNQNVVGQPQGSMMFYLIYLWQQAFTYARIGYASAMAWLLFVAIMIVTVALFIGSRRWVYYAGDAR
ncbi:MAG: spermidine/putrescine transporter permease [Chloroflexi bacterium]|nr:spermidine/putrescine transporter permease [Chloroflexota bacterium]